MLLRRALLGGGVAGGVALAIAECRQDRRPLPLLSRLDANSHPDHDKVLGEDDEGRSVVLRTLRNGSLRVRVLDWGATITSVQLPDKDGVLGEVTLGFDELQPYMDGAGPALPNALAGTSRTCCELSACHTVAFRHEPVLWLRCWEVRQPHCKRQVCAGQPGV